MNTPVFPIPRNRNTVLEEKQRLQERYPAQRQPVKSLTARKESGRKRKFRTTRRERERERENEKEVVKESKYQSDVNGRSRRVEDATRPRKRTAATIPLKKGDTKTKTILERV
jgi:hypothetical protein